MPGTSTTFERIFFVINVLGQNNRIVFSVETIEATITVEIRFIHYARDEFYNILFKYNKLFDAIGSARMYIKIAEEEIYQTLSSK